MPGREPRHPWPAPTEKNRDRPLHWLDQKCTITDVVELPVVRDGRTLMQRPDQMDGLLVPAGPNRARLEGHAGHVVLVLRPPCPHAQFHPPGRQQVDLGRLAGQQNRMTKVVVVHVTAQPQRGGHRCGSGQPRCAHG